MNTFNIITGPVRSGKSAFVKRHAKEDSDTIIDELSSPCIVIDGSKTHDTYWIVVDPVRMEKDYYKSLRDQLSKFGQVNHIEIGSISEITSSRLVTVM